MTERKKVAIKGKPLLIVLVLLLAVSGIAAGYNLSHSDRQSDGLSVSVAKDGKTIKTFSIEDIQKMPKTEIYADLQSASHDDAKGTFGGTALRTVIEQADKSLLKECSTFICIAGDGYSSAVSAEELEAEKNIILAYEKDGRALTPFREGGEGPMRMIIAKDTYGNRSVKYLTRIECKK